MSKSNELKGARKVMKAWGQGGVREITVEEDGCGAAEKQRGREGVER